MSKTFDCVFITIDQKDRRSVRVANDFNKRLLVLKRDMKSVVYQHDFQTAMSLEQILEFLFNNSDSNIEDEDVEMFRKKVSNRKLRNDKTSAQDILAAIASRKTVDSNETVTI